jgi:AcrR family transcriptional regulator
MKRSEIKGHIAQVAATLFHREGIHAVGVDRIADEAGVTKRTLYHHYACKDDLIAAALRVSPIVRFPKSGSPAEKITGVFEALAQYLVAGGYRGCPYVFYTAELLDRRHPARQIIERRVAQRRAWFRDLAAQAGAVDPELLAEELDVLFDGALAAGAKREDLRPAQAAAIAAQALLQAACAPQGLTRIA